MLEPVLRGRLAEVLEKAGGISYSWFLAHHVVIYKMTPLFAQYYTGEASVMLIFLLEAIVIFVVAFVVQKLSDLVSRAGTFARP